MLSITKRSALKVSGSMLIVNEGSVSLIDTLLNELHVVMPDTTIIGPLRLGYEEVRGGGYTCRFSDSVTTKKGFYISSIDNEIRIRDEYHDWTHYEVVTRMKKRIELANRFALNSLDHLFVIDDAGLLKVYDTDNYTYEGGTDPHPLLLTGITKNIGESDCIITIDEHDHVYISYDAETTITVYNSDCSSVLTILEADSDIHAIKVVGKRLYVACADELVIFDIKMKKKSSRR